MKLYQIKDKKLELGRKKKYDKYYNGDITSVSLRKNLKGRLQQILNTTDIFTNYNDMFVYFLFRLEEKKGVFEHQLRRYREEITTIKKHSDRMCYKVDALFRSRKECKEKLKRKNEENQYLRNLLRRHGIVNVWTKKYGGKEDDKNSS